MTTILNSIAMRYSFIAIFLLSLVCAEETTAQLITYGELLPESTVATEAQQRKLMNWLDEEFHRPATLLLRASEDGIESSTFYSQCSGIENTIVIVKSLQNAVFGGYNSGTWEFTGTFDEISGLNDNFLFTMSLEDVMPAIPGQTHMTTSSDGPTFGPLAGLTDFSISGGNANVYLGQGYDCPLPNYQCDNILNDGIDGSPTSLAIFLYDYEIWQLNSDPCTPKLTEEVFIDTNANGYPDATDNCFDPMFTGSEVVCERLDAELAQLFPEQLRVKSTRVYSSEIHGSSTEDFFEQVNGLDNSILLIKTTNGEIIGGYNQGIWSAQTGTQYELFENVLFNLNDKRLHYAIYEEVPHITNGYNGPHFGFNDLRLGFDLTTDIAYGYLGGGYQTDSNSEFNQGEYQYISSTASFTPEVVEVWKVGGDQINLLSDENENGICDYLEIYDLPVPFEDCVADLNKDGFVTAGDLTIFLTDFGSDCE